METKYFHAFQDRPPIKYRPGTSDEAIIKTVIIDRKEYVFPVMEPKIIFDIGANIGVVSVVLAEIYPKAKIYSFEPVEENFALLSENVHHLKNITPMKVGLSKKTESAVIYKSSDNTNLGGFSAYIKDGGEHMSVSMVRTATICQELGTPDLIKIDCEGAEYDILTDIPNIQDVKWISGELHGVNEFALLHRLSPNFLIQIEKRFHDKVCHFQAVSKSFSRPQEAMPGLQ